MYDEIKGRIGHKLLCWLIQRTGKIKSKEQKLYLTYKKRKLVFLDNGWETYPLHEIFFKEPYKQLNVKDKTVIDIGSSIADSPIYFVLNGAKHIFGYEPDMKRYNEAQTNIENNNMSDKITLLNKKYDGRKGDAAKIDCEGCEYSIIEQFKAFREILLEYHNTAEPFISFIDTNNYLAERKQESEKIGLLHLIKKGSIR